MNILESLYISIAEQSFPPRDRIGDPDAQFLQALGELHRKEAIKEPPHKNIYTIIRRQNLEKVFLISNMLAEKLKGGSTFEEAIGECIGDWKRGGVDKEDLKYRENIINFIAKMASLKKLDIFKH